MNDRLDPENLVHSALEFGGYPQIKALELRNLSRPDLTERAKAVVEARNEMSSQMAKFRLDRALRYQISKSALVAYTLSDQVLIRGERLIAIRIRE